jgi:RimJ/RimL family protein N-acetyltransferase
MFTLTTERLILRNFAPSDAEFILRLLNEPSFIHFIGDKGVRNLDDARQYILNGPIASYDKNGFGLYLVGLRVDNTPVGMCGLLKRESLQDVDIGFAFLPEFWNKGYALEAANAVMVYGKDVLKLPRIVAITNKDNHASAKLLNRIGLRFDRLMALDGDRDETRLFIPEDDQ